MVSSVKMLAFTLILAPVMAFAAPAKKAAVVEKSDDTITSSMGGGASIPEVLHNHLSLLGSFDFADTIEPSGGTKLDSERAVVLGAIYEFNQFSPGLSAQVGGTYDFSREVKNAGGLKLQEWTTFGEVAVKVVPQFKIMGGVNYNFPNLTGAAPGASIKGKIGFQIGASYQFAPNFAIDGRYRMQEMEASGPNGAGGTTTTGIKMSGLLLGGRYIF